MAKWLDKYENGGEYLGTTNVGRNYSPAWGGQFQMGGYVYPTTFVPQAQKGLTFLQPTSSKLPIGYPGGPIPASSEVAMSIGGEGGEPAYLVPSFKYGQPLEDAYKEFLRTGEHLGGPFKTWQEADEWEQNIRHPYVEKGQDIPTPLKTWSKDYPLPTYEMGGSIPGSVGFTYARTGSTPSEGPYAKKTLPSAQNGQEMSFYQHGLDWTPRNISKNGSVVKDNMGYWNPDNWGKVVEIDSPNITMRGVNQDLIGISDEGDVQYMEREKPGKPGKDYKFKGKKVKEYPVAKYGVNQQDEKTAQHLDQLLNFTNYNKPTKGGWLDKY
jgi:hypothetical protein